MQVIQQLMLFQQGTKEEFLRCNRTMAYAQTLQNSVQYYRNLTKANLEALVYW